MAKALGTTPEEEHRMGIHKLAKVRSELFEISTDVLMYSIANTRPGRRIIYRHRTRRGHRMVRRLSTTRLRAGWEYCQSDRDITPWSRYADTLRPSGALSS
jgi:hypothetical protein